MECRPYKFDMEQLIAGLFGLVLGVVGLVTAITLFKKRSAFSLWKTTQGTVIERGAYQPDIPMLSAPAFRYAPLVRYSYTVDGKEFISNTIFPRRIQLPQRSKKQWAERKAQAFPDDVTVHYNPDDPGESYLVMTSKLTLGVVVAASCFATIVGVLFLLAWLL